MKSLDTLQSRRGGRRRRPVTLAASALVLVALVVAACGQAAPTAALTAVSHPAACGGSE